MKRNIDKIRILGCAFLLALLSALSAVAETWDAGADPDLSWGSDANWDTDSVLVNPATSLITFNETGAISGSTSTNTTSRLDQDRTLNTGLLFTHGEMDATYRHNLDLDGKTITLNGSTLSIAVNQYTHSFLAFTNGTLIVGQASKASILIGSASDDVSGSLLVNCSFSNNLDKVELGKNADLSSAGTLDLRNSTPVQRSFVCDVLTVGKYALTDSAYPGYGYLYLNDRGGQITNLTVTTNFTFGGGAVALNPGTTIIIGTSSSARATMAIGQAVNATLTPTGGQVTAYLNSLIIGDSANIGTLDLTNAPNTMLDVVGAVFLGYNAGSGYGTAGGIGVLRLGTGTMYFRDLKIGVNTTVTTNSQLLLRGGVLTIGNSTTNIFEIAATNKLILDFVNSTTQLKVYGNYASSGPATNINTYIADGRIVITNGTAEIGYDGTYSYVKLQSGSVTSAYNSWTWKMPVTFTNDSRIGTLTNFPALITLSTNISGFSYSDFAYPSNGADLCFSDAGQTTNLNYEIEQWNTNGTSYVWVQVPLLTPGTNIVVYWGNALQSVPPTYTTNGATWSNSCAGVWHFNETVTDEATGGIHYDATTNHNNGTQYYNVTTNGLIGKAQYFDGVSDYVSVPANSSLNAASLTLSYWLKNAGTGAGWPRVTTRGGAWDTTLGSGNPGQLGFYLGGWVSAGFYVPQSAWTHVAWTFEGGTLSLYTNGVYCTNWAKTYTPSGTLGIGGNNGSASENYVGAMDEVRWSSVSRSSNWIWACWANQMTNTAFASNGAVVTTTSGSPAINTTMGAAGVTTTNAWLQATLTSTGTAATAVWSYWGTNNGGTNASTWVNTNYFGTNSSACPVAYSNQAANLSPNTLYYYVFKASNANGICWSGVRSFTTPTPPVIDNDGGATQINSYKARLNGTLTAGTPADVSICWGETDCQTNELGTKWAHTNNLGSLSAGSFSVFATNLTAGVTYYYRCFATNGIGIGWAPTTTNFTAPVNAGAAAFSSWMCKLRITFIDDSRIGTLTNFPALVTFSTNISGFRYNDFAYPSNGADLCFSDAGQTTNLNYEIEKWDTNGTSYVWVQVPLLLPGTDILAYWGNAGQSVAPTYTTNGATWTNSGCAGVWHFNETVTDEATGGIHYDATTNHNNGTQYYNVTTNGVIGKAQYFDGVSDYVSVPNHSSLNAASLTLSYWVNDAGTASSWCRVSQRGGWDATVANGDPGQLGFFLGSWVSTGFFVPQNAWTYVTWTFAGGTLSLYKNGIYCTSWSKTYTPSGTLVIGGNNGAATENFKGGVDEVRWSSVTHSSNWIWACWANQTTNSAFTSNGAVAVTVATSSGTVIVIY